MEYTKKSIYICSMKIAALVYGEYRTFDKVVNTWEFKDKCDFYVSTWDICKQVKPINITKDMITNFIPNANVIIEEDNDKHMFNSQKMITHWRKLINAVSESYDYLMLIRTDSYIKFKTSFDELINKLNKDTLYVYGDDMQKENNQWVQDTFFIGSQHIITNLIKKTPHYVDNPHRDIALSIMINRFKIETLYEIETYPLPPTTIQESIDLETVQNDWIKWTKETKHRKLF